MAQILGARPAAAPMVVDDERPPSGPERRALMKKRVGNARETDAANASER